MTQREFDKDIQDGMKEWNKIGDMEIPVFSLYYYYPKKRLQHNVTEDQESVRDFIYKFKDGENPDDVAEQIITVLKLCFLQETISDITLVCIPASTKEKNRARYEKFSSIIAQECNMWNAYDHIKIDYDRNAKHNGGESDYDNLSFDSSWFEGKDVLIFDDIVTKGNSICKMREKLEGLGANVIGAITLGQTVYVNKGKDPYYQMDKSIKIRSQKKRQFFPSAQESAHLYKVLKNVDCVAKYRGIKPSTVYGHLFSTGVLYPWDFIAISEYDKAMEIYEMGYKHPSLELDNFLDTSAKAAFYFITQHSKL